jgi:hypothetical protein
MTVGWHRMNDHPSHELACRCLDAPLPDAHYSDIEFIGIDETEGRFGEVRIKQCRHCSRYWLQYSVAYEQYAESGRYFMGIIEPENIHRITPETALDYLDTLAWHLFGGSYFGGRGKGDGRVGPLT